MQWLGSPPNKLQEQKQKDVIGVLKPCGRQIPAGSNSFYGHSPAVVVRGRTAVLFPPLFVAVAATARPNGRRRRERPVEAATEKEERREKCPYLRRKKFGLSDEDGDLTLAQICFR